MKKLIFSVFCLVSLSSYPSDVSKNCKDVSQKKTKETIEILHLFASSVLSNEGLIYIDTYREALKSDHYSCEEFASISKDIISGLKQVLAGLALTNGYENITDYATDMYCLNTQECEINESEKAKTMYIFKKLDLKNKLQQALKK